MGLLEKFIMHAQLFIKQKNEFKLDHKLASEFIDKTFKIMPPPFNFIEIFWRSGDNEPNVEKFIAILENLLINKTKIENIGIQISDIKSDLLSSDDINNLEKLLLGSTIKSASINNSILKNMVKIKRIQKRDSQKIAEIFNLLKKSTVTSNNSQNELITNASKIHYDKNIKRAMNNYELKNKNISANFDEKYIKNNVQTLLQLINYYYYNSKYDDAIKYCNIILNVTKNISVLYNKGVILYALKKYDQVLECLHTVIKLNPNFHYAHSTLSVTYLQLNKFDNALHHCNKAIKLQPNYSEAYSNKGMIHASRNEYAEALNCLDHAIELNPHLPGLYVNKSIVLNNINNFDESIRCCDIAINVDPKFSHAYHNKGRALANCYRYEDAIKFFDIAISLEPNFVGIYSDKASALANLDMYDDSLDCCNMAIQLDPTNANVLSIMGSIYGEKKEFDKSIQYLNKAIELDPKHYRSYNNKAQIYLRMKKYENALNSVEDAIKLAPTNPLPYFNKGEIYLALHNLDLALISYNKSINIRKNFAPSYFGLAKIFFEMKKYRDVDKYCEKTLELQPKYPRARPLKIKAIEQYVVEFLTKEYGYSKKLIDINSKIKIKNTYKYLDVVGYSSTDKTKIQFFIEFKNYIGNFINSDLRYLVKELKPDFIIIWKNYDVYKIYQIINEKIINIDHIPKSNENIHVDMKINDPIIKFQRIIDYFRRSGIHRYDYAVDLAKIIACKMYDELNKKKIFINFTTNPKNIIRQLECVWNDISNKYPEFQNYDKFLSDPKIIADVCNEIKYFSFLKTGKYEICIAYLISISSDHDLTLSSILETTAYLLNIENDKKIIYPFCNFGYELLAIHNIFSPSVNKNKRNLTYCGIEPNKTKSMIASFIFTFLGMKNIILTDNPLSAKPYQKLHNYDYAIISPIFGKLQPELKIKFNKNSFEDDTLSHVVSLTSEYIDRNGKIGLIVPHNFLNGSKYSKIRTWLLSNYNISAIISIPNHNIRLFNFPVCIIILEKNKHFSNNKIFVSYIHDMYEIHPVFETHKLNKIFKKLVLQYNLFKQTNEICSESDEMFFIKKSDLKNDWSIQHLTPSSVNMIKQLSNKTLLHDVADIIPGKFIPKTHISNEGIPYIRISDIKNGILTTDNSIRINEKYVKSNNVTFIHANDILLSRQGTIGKTCVVPRYLHGCCLSPQLVILRIKRNSINPEFIKYQIMYSEVIKRQFLNYQRGSFIRAISVFNLKNIYISIPPLRIQKKYLKKTNELLIDEQKLEKKSEELKSEMSRLL